MSIFVVTADQLKDAVIRKTDAIIGRANTYNADVNMPGLAGREFLTKVISKAEQLTSKYTPAPSKKFGL